VLAIYSLNAVGGISELKLQIAQMDGGTGATMNLFPPLDMGGEAGFLGSPLFMFIIFITVMWWSSHNADGGGYIIQRMLAAKSEGHSLVGTLWFNLAHYALRPWPWIIVALASMVTFPHISQEHSKEAYPAAINAFLPHGLKGLLVASFLAAFMSTIDTHINWGTSYFINDIYKRFIRKSSSERHYVLVSRITAVVLMAIAGLVASRMESITAAWEFLIPMSAGIGLVLILRWFWWRINAWSEISALIASMVINVPLVMNGVGVQHRLMVIVPFSIMVWMLATFLTEPVPKEKLMEFYSRVRPGGIWGPVKEELPHIKRGVLGWGLLVEWFCGVALIYGSTFGIGKLIFHEYGHGAILLGIAAVGGGVIAYRLTRKEAFG
ncbi:MAG: sodium:proline symporter, partial [Candidatus Brocadiales bacterium]